MFYWTPLNILPLLLMISWIRKRTFGQKIVTLEIWGKGTRELKDVARDPRVLLLGAEGTSTEPVGGRGGRFKVAGNSRVPLVDAMNPMAELICDQIGSSFGTDAANTVSDSRKDLENP
uniref:Uncharacterized protein n=1 Tax=Gossypium raimondii TaxID=29730 RepID=A0A0D2NKP2_GOSRA|nr:hypothetical protein B456_002G101500 [Gossypium raimondii]KJB13913.1 hypothetical protein B456_002G101500 [Gossypium raimondii]